MIELIKMNEIDGRLTLCGTKLLVIKLITPYGNKKRKMLTSVLSAFLSLIKVIKQVGGTHLLHKLL